jgi:RNA polymerase sigma-70 factor, ECF subfamily
LTEPRDLLQRIASGDAEALTVLYRRYRPGVRMLCARMTGDADEAEDLTQEVFLRAVRRAGGFRGESSAGTWLYRVARNICLDHLRRVERQEKSRSSAVHEFVGAREASSGEGGADLPVAMEKGLRRLAIEDREVVVLAACLGLGSAELAEILECSPGAARVRLHRALARLRQLCAEREEEPDGLRTGA